MNHPQSQSLDPGQALDSGPPPPMTASHDYVAVVVGVGGVVAVVIAVVAMVVVVMVVVVMVVVVMVVVVMVVVGLAVVVVVVSRGQRVQ